ncbi:hypothetical protein Tco_0792056 [Tanacetum coccineum]
MAKTTIIQERAAVQKTDYELLDPLPSWDKDRVAYCLLDLRDGSPERHESCDWSQYDSQHHQGSPPRTAMLDLGFPQSRLRFPMPVADPHPQDRIETWNRNSGAWVIFGDIIQRSRLHLPEVQAPAPSIMGNVLLSPRDLQHHPMKAWHHRERAGSCLQVRKMGFSVRCRGESRWWESGGAGRGYLQRGRHLGDTAALAARDANRSMNGEDNHNSGTGVRRTERVARECTYQDFMKCQPLYLKGTEGVVELTQWFERMETVFSISNCSMENQTKFSTCTLVASALTWWNSHVMTVGHDVAYAMTWTDRRKKMTDKYCPRNEMKKLETELYVGGLPNIIHGNIVASRPKTMQDAIKIATELMDKKISTLAERQAEKKRKLDNNNQDQQQSPKRQYVQAAPQWAMYCKVRELQEGYYRSDCPELKNQNHGNQAEGTRARGVVHALRGGETDQDPNNIKDEIEA